ncbi:MAG TPA: hypothetical protein PKC90_12285 [Phycisphaerales bacterium]|nr:hypothetical protein [Phycisphaerales bacterium]
MIEAPDRTAALDALLRAFLQAKLEIGDETHDDAEDDSSDEGGLASPMWLGPPFNLTLDWWTEKTLKPWAGSMNAGLIFRAMREAIDVSSLDPLNDRRVVRDPIDPASPRRKPEKREPFYFDSLRGGNAKSLDIGFAPDAFSMTSAACPAVESLSLVGLQRFRPMPAGLPRVFVYRAWNVALPPSTAAAAACGVLAAAKGEQFRFQNAFRTDQRKHKGFLPATRVTEGDTP